LNSAKVDLLVKPALPPTCAVHGTGRIPSENCVKIRDLGFTMPNRIKMYGERFEVVSDPFDEDGCVVVQAISGDDPTIRILRLPVAILVGLSGRFEKSSD
jgi:hypothetical protein